MYDEAHDEESRSTRHGYFFSTLIANLVMPSTFAKIDHAHHFAVVRVFVGRDHQVHVLRWPRARLGTLWPGRRE